MTNLEKMAKVMEEATCYMNKEETPRDQKKTKKNTYQEKTVDENEGGIDDKEEEKKGRKMQKKKRDHGINSLSKKSMPNGLNGLIIRSEITGEAKNTRPSRTSAPAHWRSHRRHATCVSIRQSRAW